MTKQTKSEALFASFCSNHNLDWARVPAAASKTPDYRLRFGQTTVAFEIKQLDGLAGFNPGGVSSRTVGYHVRQKITEARKQLQAAAASGEPAVLLIYNAVDPFQSFGTEQHDFICAMYGDLTVDLSRESFSKPFHGRNAKLRAGMNTSFSAVGHLRLLGTGAASVTLYENVYAAHPLPFERLPTSLEVIRVSVQDAA